MAQNAFRRLAIKRWPISQPKIVKIDIQNQISNFGGARQVSQIRLPLLSDTPPTIESPFTKLEPSFYIHPYDLANIQVSVVDPHHNVVLNQPTIIDVQISSLLDIPTIVDLFAPLKGPKCAGKSYNELEDTEPSEVHKNSDFKQPSLLPNTCIHGIERSTCSTCEENKQRKKTKRKKRTAKTKPLTVDVFELLRPYLEPPLETLLVNRLLFPVGRRPYPHQVPGIKFLFKNTSALLGDEMGLGKTIQTIVALQVLYQRGALIRTLILCPKAVIGAWHKTIQEWAPEFYVQRVRAPKNERSALWKAPASIYLTTYETLRDDLVRFPELKTYFDMLVLDEIQKIRNPQSKISRAVRSVQSKYRWGLSGTPIENKLEDAIAIFDFLKPGLFTPNEALNPNMVQKRIEPYFLRRRTADVLDELPPKWTKVIWLELTNAQKDAYIRVERESRESLEQPGATRMHVFAKLRLLMQICNRDDKTGESCKLDYLKDELTEIRNQGDKALVFSHLPNKTLDAIKPDLQGFDIATYNGSLSDRQREALVLGFEETEKPKVLLMSVQSGGVGITLTRANHVFHYDHWWNPAIARQAEGRAHRIGQKKTVFVHDLYTIGTVEERIFQLLQRKQALFDQVIDGLSIEEVQKGVTDEELFGLFDLEPPKSEDVQKEVTDEELFRLFDLETPKGESNSKNIQPEFTDNEQSKNGTNFVIVSPDNSYNANTGYESATQSSAKHEQSTDYSGIASKIDALSPIEFEHLIKQIYQKMGYKAEVTSGSRDGGVDVIARKYTGMHGEEVAIIQCKHYKSQKVGVGHMRELIGAWKTDYPYADNAVMITSGEFSSDAIEIARKSRIILKDGMDVRQLYARHFTES